MFRTTLLAGAAFFALATSAAAAETTWSYGPTVSLYSASAKYTSLSVYQGNTYHDSQSTPAHEVFAGIEANVTHELLPLAGGQVVGLVSLGYNFGVDGSSTKPDTYGDITDTKLSNFGQALVGIGYKINWLNCDWTVSAAGGIEAGRISSVYRNSIDKTYSSTDTETAYGLPGRARLDVAFDPHWSAHVDYQFGSLMQNASRDYGTGYSDKSKQVYTGGTWLVGVDILTY